MDTQLVGEDDGDEWAVDRILSHHGARTEATFEILWKSGNASPGFLTIKSLIFKPLLTT